MEYIYGWKFLSGAGCTYYDGKPFLYNLPMADEKWRCTTHPEPAQPDGEACGPDRLHAMKTLDARYALANWHPWRARTDSAVLIGQDHEKWSAPWLELRRVPTPLWWRYLRRFGQGADLRGADLRETDLWEADLRGADLRGADLWRANLREANLWEANLQGADLWEANLWEVNLREVNLRRAHLRGADLRRANLWEANLQGANLWRVRWDSITIWPTGFLPPDQGEQA